MKIPAPLIYGRLLLSLLGGLVCAALYWFSAVQPLDRVIYDIFNEAAPLPQAGDIVIVAVDEDSLAELGRWPWPRENHVELVRQLQAADVAAVAIDMLFVEPYHEYPAVDGLLAEALAQLRSSVLPVFVGQAGPAGQLREMRPVEPIASEVAALGHVHIEVDSDGVARSVYLFEGLGVPQWPHFALALARVLNLDIGPLPGISDEEVLANPDPQAIIRSHKTLIPFIGGPGTVAQVSYVEVMKGRVPVEALQDKIVFVGATAAGHVDNITTSLGQISGVEINANIFHALRSGKLAEPVHIVPASLLGFGLIALTIFGFTRLAPSRLLLAVLAGAVLLLLASFLLLQSLRLWISPAPMLLTLLFAYPLWNWLRLATAMDFIQEQLLQLEHENRRGFLGEEAAVAPEHNAASSDPVNEILQQLDRAYRESRDNHELVRGTLEQLASGVILSETSGLILLVNDEARELLGQADLSRDLHGALGGIDLEEGREFEHLFAELMQTGVHFNHEGFALATQRDLLLQGGVIGLDRPLVLLVLTDVSELKQSEKRRAEALNFLSHDLRAPLTSVLALIEGARGSAENVASLGLLRQIEKYIEANLSYAENFIQLAKLEQTSPPRFDECDPQSLLDNAVAQLYHSAASRGIALHLTGTEEDLWVNCSRDLVERVLMNLIDNALKHSQDGSALELGIARDAGYVQFTVRDQGEGIDPEDMQRIFEEFQQGTHARSGAGLGLRFVQAVATAHGGNISAANNPDGGSCFTLLLPLPRTMA